MKDGLLKNELWPLVRGIAEGLEGVISPAAAENGLTLSQVRLLISCSYQPNLTVGVLSRQTGIAAANVSAMCRRLERDGFLKRLRDPADERLVHICLTGQGEAAIQSVERVIQTRCDRLFGREEPAEIEQMLAGLQKLNSLLQQLADESGSAGGQ